MKIIALVLVLSILVLPRCILADGTEVRAYTLRYVVIFHNDKDNTYRVRQYRLDINGDRYDEAELDVPADYLEQHHRESKQ